MANIEIRGLVELQRLLDGLIVHGYQGKIGNNTAYGPFVQSQQFQARVHRGRWQTDEQVLTQELPAIEQDFNRTVQDAIDHVQAEPDLLKAPMFRACYRIQARMATYPPQRPGSTYRRTGTLGRRWTSTVQRT